MFKVVETFTFTLGEHPHANGQTHQTPTRPQTIEGIPVLKDVARLDNCVTVVDALNFDATFNTADYLSDRFKGRVKTKYKLKFRQG